MTVEPFIFGAGCDIVQKEVEEMPIKTGDAVKIEYILRIHRPGACEDIEKASCEFIVGDGTMLPKVDQAILGCNHGDLIQVILAPDDAYNRIEEAVVFIPVEQFDHPPKEEYLYEVTVDGVHCAWGECIGIRDGDAIIDANEPLAGHELSLDIEISCVNNSA